MNWVNRFFLYVGLMMSASVFAGNMEYRIRGDVLEYANVIKFGPWQSPPGYTLTPFLPVARSFILGNPLDTEWREYEFSNGSNTVRLGFQLSGIEVVLSDSFTREDLGTGASVTIEGNTYQTIGSGLANVKINYSRDVTPFVSFRPKFRNFDADQFIEKFTQAKAPKGIYKAKLQNAFAYEYYRNGARIKQVVPFEVNISFNYNPAILNSVTIVSGNGVIEPRYYGYPEKLVGGETSYQLQVNGDFQSGLKMGLRSSKHLDGLFALRPVDATTHSTDTNITYNVRCTNGCDGNGEIIRDGQAMIDDTNNRIDILPVDPTQSATIGININFGNKPLADIPNGLYQDSFVLIFETLL